MRQVRFAGLTYVTPGAFVGRQGNQGWRGNYLSKLSVGGVQLEQSRERNTEDRRVYAPLRLSGPTD